MKESRLVSSTETGRICTKCGRPKAQCACKRGKARLRNQQPADGIIRIGREVKGRKCKTVTTISGLPGGLGEIKKIATDLKNRCGTGGSVKDSTIILQGDHREVVKSLLLKMGFKVKLAGG